MVTSRYFLSLTLFFLLCFLVNTPVLAIEKQIEKNREYYEKRPEGVDRITWVNDYLKFYPKTKERKLRYVIIPTEFTEESKGNRILEVRAGKKLMIQPCGEHLLETSFESKEFPSQSGRLGIMLKYYELTFGEVNRSIIYCTLDRESKFVQGEHILIPLESDHPIVIYSRDKTLITYRIWNATKEYKKAEPFRAYYLE